ncbi:hypothetical protein J3A83DRAFT_4154711 [Scleroderma citrinum]
MAGGSPTAFLLWSLLACLFYCFLIFHLWNYDRFKCLRWGEASRRPGAFKRVMTYTYVAALTLLVIFGSAYTLLKFKEGGCILQLSPVTSRPLEMYSPSSRKWVLPLLFVFSAAWSCELHHTELTFWLFLQNQGPRTRVWFDSWEFKLWLWGSILAIFGMPLTTVVARQKLDVCLAWILVVGSSASTLETLSFIFVLVRFPAFIRKVKDDGAAPNIIVRLVYSYQLNCGRIVFRFLFSVPLLTLGIDGVQGSHPINMSSTHGHFMLLKEIPDFLMMLAGLGCFVSSGITLLVFFPRSLITELGYTITTPAATPVKTSVTPSAEFRPLPVHYPESAPGKHTLRPSPSSSVEFHQEYEPADPTKPIRPHSYSGHVRIPRAEASGTERLSAPYVFDDRLKGLVRSHSDSPGLHPYVSTVILD